MSGTEVVKEETRLNGVSISLKAHLPYAHLPYASCWKMPTVLNKVKLCIGFFRFLFLELWSILNWSLSKIANLKKQKWPYFKNKKSQKSENWFFFVSAHSASYTEIWPLLKRKKISVNLFIWLKVFFKALASLISLWIRFTKIPFRFFFWWIMVAYIKIDHISRAICLKKKIMN